MRSFEELLAISAERKGGVDAVLGEIDAPLSAQKLAEIPDDRWLSAASRGIFQAGFNWKVVENMWPGFEAAFKGFDIGKCAMMDGEWFDALVTDTSIVRHGPKIRAVQQNAVFIGEKATETGGFGKFVGEWPDEDYASLLLLLKAEGTRLGGNTGPYFMRVMGRDGYILSRDVTARLIAEGVIDKPATSKKGMMAVQEAFNTWRAQSGRSMKEISRVLATSTG